jgi:hypothetical protein
MESYIQYRSFNDPALATELTDILKSQSIPFIQEDNTSQFNLTFTESALTKEYIVKLKVEDFERANNILKETAKQEINQVDKDHYLYTFTDEELIDIVKKPDEWNSLDYELAQKLLKERGVQFNLESIKKERLQELSQPETSQKTWIIIGYIFVPLGSIIALLIGYFIYNQKRTLPNGERVFSYSQDDRWHGKMLLIAGVISFLIGLSYTIYRRIYLYN